ncbi:acetolactate synthase large subunit [Patescibacteria group bacterium]|nr:acetolactate synthase large subunit [Patescibacteria group bacterium]
MLNKNPKTAAEIIVEALETEGVKYVFGLPGEENLSLLQALSKSTQIKFILTRHEQTAAFMAATYGRLTGKAGVVLSTLGPGATNLVTGAAYANLGGMPLIIITGQKALRKSRQGHFQILDVVRMMEPVTKLASTIVSADRAPFMVREAFKVAESERPGAVHLELPEDIAEDITDKQVLLPVKVRRPGPDPKAITEAANKIMSAQRPLIVIGAGANRKRIHKHLSEFVKKTGIPFITTQMGKGVLDETKECYIGNTALSEGDYIHCALQKADLLIVVGHETVEKPPLIMAQGDREVIHINFSEADVDYVYAPTLEVVGDIAHSLWALAEKIKPSVVWDFSYYKKLSQKLKEHILEKADDSAWPLKPQRLAKDLRDFMPADSILALDNGMYKLWLARNFPAREPNTVLLDNALATMGAGLASAMAAKLLNPEKLVVAVVGDGGFMMSLGDLETAVRLSLDLVVVVLNDKGLGMIKWKQQQMGFTDFGLDFTNPDFVSLAKSFGAGGLKVESAEGFTKALDKAKVLGGVQIIDCPIDYSENKKVFDEELKQKTCEL